MNRSYEVAATSKLTAPSLDGDRATVKPDGGHGTTRTGAPVRVAGGRGRSPLDLLEFALHGLLALGLGLAIGRCAVAGRALVTVAGGAVARRLRRGCLVGRGGDPVEDLGQ